MDQHMVAQIGGSAELPAQPRGAYREHVDGCERNRAVPRQAAIADTNDGVVSVGDGIDSSQRCRELKIDAWVQVVELPPSRHQPAHCKSRVGADRQGSGSAAVAYLVSREREPIERVGYLVGKGTTALGQRYRSPAASKELNAERALQRLDLATDRPGRDGELLRRAREVQLARRSVERAQRGEGRKPTHHGINR